MSTLALAHRFYQNPPEPSFVLQGEPREIDASYALRESSTEPAHADRLIARVAARAGSLSNSRMNAELGQIVSVFRTALVETGIDAGGAPALEIVDADDGSVLIEWHFADRRLGFNIEPREGESGWYFVFSKSSGGQCGSGLLASLDMNALLQTMLAKRPRP
jgi:hypothetical protein